MAPCDPGVSGPAALKLSAFGARVLSEGGYRGKLVVNWLAGNNPSKVRARRTPLLLRICTNLQAAVQVLVPSRLSHVFFSPTLYVRLCWREELFLTPIRRLASDIPVHKRACQRRRSHRRLSSSEPHSCRRHQQQPPTHITSRHWTTSRRSDLGTQRRQYTRSAP